MRTTTTLQFLQRGQAGPGAWVRAAVACLAVATALARAADGSDWLGSYQGRPFADDESTAPAAIPGRVECERYDLGGEGVAFHDSDAANSGSGALNPANGDPLNEFRMKEAVDISYTKPGGIDDNPFNRWQPPPGSLYLGWTVEGEWLNYTVDVREAGAFRISIPCTANGDGAISLCLDGGVLATIAIPTTNDPAETVAWRQWHHWQLLTGVATVELPAGRHVLTLKIESHGQLNLDALIFEPAAKLAKHATWAPPAGRSGDRFERATPTFI